MKNTSRVQKNWNTLLFTMLILPIIGLIIMSGCSGGGILPEKRPDPSPKKFVPLWCMTGAMVKSLDVSINPPDIMPDVVPDDSPDDDVVLTKDCTNCSGRGWVGDGQPQGDCPACDSSSPPDGDPNEPDSKWTSRAEPETQTAETKEPETKFVEIAEQTLDSPGPTEELKWFKDSRSAIQEAKRLNKNILVLLDEQSPEEQWDTLLVKSKLERFVLLFGDTSDKLMANSWASRLPTSDNVELVDGFYKFNVPIYCVLNPKGIFITEYKECDGDALHIIESIEDLNLKEPPKQNRNSDTKVNRRGSKSPVKDIDDEEETQAV